MSNETDMEANIHISYDRVDYNMISDFQQQTDKAWYKTYWFGNGIIQNIAKTVLSMSTFQADKSRSSHWE